MFLTNPKEKPRYIVRELFVVHYEDWRKNLSMFVLFVKMDGTKRFTFQCNETSDEIHNKMVSHYLTTQPPR